MSEKLTRFTRSQLPVFGFGYYRQQTTDKPWFSSVDYVNAVGVMPGVRYGDKPAISRAGFIAIANQFSENGLVLRRDEPEDERSARGSGRLRTQIMTTPQSVDVMLDTIVHRVRHEGQTVPEMLLNPVIGKLILETTDLKDRIIDAVSQPTEYQNRFYWS